jgi:hypothetical protein
VNTVMNCGNQRAYFLSPDDIWNAEARWNDVDRRKYNDSEKELSLCHFVHLKSHMD